ncbi:MAG: ABC transporter substrate-binding protein [Gammaproteobacteria bacterium]|nr:ABC transporter substrate-binding protein [Gammaproteobacteria bacterium]
MAVTDPQALVKKTTEQVLAEISAKKQELTSNPGQIYSLVDDILLPRFDFNQISRLVLGKHWKQATKAQKSSFIKEFRELLVRTYATALLHYSGQEINYPPIDAKPDAKRVKVRTKVQDKGAGAVPIDYSLYLRKESWKVYDVTIDGVSLVSTYRSNFNSQIKRHKLSGLISNIKQRNSKGQ